MNKMDARQKHVVLIGMMGAGKSATAKALAKLHGRPCFDCDRQIEKDTGKMIPEIFDKEGEPMFREYEHRALKTLLQQEPAIIAVGGGAVVAWANRLLLRDHAWCVWLEASVKTLAKRTGGSGKEAGGEQRPLLSGHGEQGKREKRLGQLLAERASIYGALAQYNINTDDKTPEAVAEAIIHAYQQDCQPHHSK